MKKLFALILALAMILGMTGAFAEAAGNEVWLTRISAMTLTGTIPAKR